MVLRIWIGICISSLFFSELSVGVLIPAKDASSEFAAYDLGFSDGDLYLYSGDSIHLVDFTNPMDPKFSLHMSGLESAFGGERRSFDGSFATGPGGKAAVAMGFTSGGVLLVDLNEKTTSVLPDLNGDDENDNVFSMAASSEGTFYATWVSRSFTPVDATKIYQIDPDTGIGTLVEDVDPGRNSGGMAFDPFGNLLATSFEPTGAFPDPTGKLRLFRVPNGDLSDADPNAISLASGSANGSSFLAVDDDANVFFNTMTGIGLIANGSSVATNFFGNIQDPNLFGPPFTDDPATLLEGLAYDAADNRLVFTRLVDNDTNAYELVFMNVPEPATLAIVVGGGLVMVRRSRWTMDYGPF